MIDDFKMLLINLELGTLSALLESTYNLRYVVKPDKKNGWKAKDTGSSIASADTTLN